MPLFPFRGVWPTIAEDVFIAPGAMIIGNVTIESEASIWYNAVVRGDVAPIVIGRRTNVQDNCTLHVNADAPLTIGAECTIGHNAVVHGALLGDQVLVGMNAVVLSHAQVASRTIIGSCALISEQKHFPQGVLALGVPARVVRELLAEELAYLKQSADGYFARAQEYRQLPDLSQR